MVAIARPQSRFVVAACFAVLGAAVLGVQAAWVFSVLRPGRAYVFSLVVGVVGVLITGTAIAAALAALRAPKLARILALLALAGSVFFVPLMDVPPRGLPILLLAIAAAVMVVSPSADRTDDRSRRHPVWAVALGWLGITVHGLVGVLYPTAGLIAPTYGLTVLWVIWAALLFLAFRVKNDSPILTPLVPLAAIGAWFGVMYLGGQFLGWAP